MALIKKHFTIFALVLIYLLGLISYFNSFRGEFVFDDVNTVTRQEKLKNLSDIKTIWNANKSRFIPYLTYAVNYRLDKLNPSGFHIVSFILHIANAYLIFFLMSRLQKNKVLPLITAIIFTVHPIQTQAVTYISQRSTLLSAFFYLLTVFLYLRKSNLSFILTFPALVLALLSKENSYTLPLVILSTEIFFFRNRGIKKSFFRILPYFLITAVVFNNFYLTERVNPIEKISSIKMLDEVKIKRSEYLLTQTNVIRTYLKLLFFPVNLNVDYDFPISRSFWEVPVLVSTLILFCFILIALKVRKKKPLFSYGIIFFFITLLIESSIIPIKDVMNEHRLYLPSVGFFLAMSSTGKRIYYKKYFYPAVTVLIVVLMLLTINRNKVWQSEYNLWKDTVIKSPLKARVHYNLGVASYGINRFDEAKKEFTKTIELDPYYSDAYRNLGTIFEDEGENQKAIDLYNKGLMNNYQDTKIRAQLAFFYSKRGKYEEAVREYFKILEYDPDKRAVYNELGMIYFMQNKKEEAEGFFTRALRLDPNYETALQNLANLYFHFGMDETARNYYQKLIKLNPENSQAKYFLSLDDN